MRALEVTLIFANVPILACYISKRTVPVGLRVFPGIALLLLIVHGTVEGSRWPMYPAYLVVVWLFLACVWPRVTKPGFWTGAAGLGCLLGAAAMATALPVFEFPMPTGPFPIGSVTRHFIDKGREEPQSRRPGAHRELVVQIWYPAQFSGPGQPYRLRSETPFKKEHLTLVKTHGAAGVPIASASQRYPVLICIPSWIGSRNQNTFQTEELASHGFVVVGIDHPYSSTVTVFPDGRSVRSALVSLIDYSSDQAFDTSIRIHTAQLQLRTADARFVLDELERLNQHDPTGLLTGHIDTTRVGVFGHSFGGAVAAETCRLDSRFRSGINLDGVLFGESAANGVEQPFLFMNCDSPIPTELDLAKSSGKRRRQMTIEVQKERHIRQSLAKHGGYRMRIRGVTHMNFCDSPLYSPIKRLTDAGPIDVSRSMRIMNDYTLAFFDQHLNSRPQNLLKGASEQYPEVRLEVWPPPVR